MNPVYTVYIKTDNEYRIIAVDSSAYLSDFGQWLSIDQGVGAKYRRAQTLYFPDNIYDHRGICRYLYTPDGETLWRERTQEEMDADWVEPVPVPDPTERIAALEAQLAAYEAAYNQGVNEA